MIQPGLKIIGSDCVCSQAYLDAARALGLVPPEPIDLDKWGHLKFVIDLKNRVYNLGGSVEYGRSSCSLHPANGVTIGVPEEVIHSINLNVCFLIFGSLYK